MRRPNVFILGAAKCGTTSLHHYLDQHPAIFMSRPKEPFFFEAEYQNGLDYYLNHYFADWAAEPLAGEARHRNLYLPFVANRIRATVPEAKFVVLVRNPVDRAFSHWWHWHSRRVEPLSFEDAIDANLRRLETGPHFADETEADLYRRTLDFSNGHSPFASYLDSGYYAEQIERFTGAFGADRLCVLFFEDLSRDPQAVADTVFRFLGVDAVTLADKSARNPSLPARMTAFTAAAGRIPGLVALGRPLRPLLDRLPRRSSPTVRQHMNQRTRDDLLRHFAPHIDALERMTGRTLNAWRETGHRMGEPVQSAAV